MKFFSKFKLGSLAMWIVVLPLLIAIIYYAFFSIDRYVSTARVVVRQAGAAGMPQMPGLAVMLGGGNPTSREETLYLREYIISLDMLQILRKEHNWQEHFSQQWRDPLFWLDQEASTEDLLIFYQRMVRTYYDEVTGLLTVEVQGLRPEFAEDVLATILIQSEHFVNELSHKMARVQMLFSETELANAKKNYDAIRQEMLEFQSANNFLDAEASAKSRSSAIFELEKQLISERANLISLLATLNSDTPQVKQQRVAIRSLEQQLAVENKRLISSSSGNQLNVIAARYRDMMIDVGIAEEAYKFSVSAVETSRIEASKQIRSLVTVVSPNLPQRAVYPSVIYNLLTLVIGLLLFYGICRFVIATIRDHQD